MKIIQGDLWSEIGKAELILFSANATINSRGQLVMGAGAAREARDRFPGLARHLGQRLLQSNLAGQDYGITLTGTLGNQENNFLVLGAFQVKLHWKEPADLGLIRYSCKELRRYTSQYSRVAMNYPGIGLGALTKDEVQPVLEAELGDLDNIYIYWR